jgi:hypothetical protein
MQAWKWIFVGCVLGVAARSATDVRERMRREFAQGEAQLATQKQRLIHEPSLTDTPHVPFPELSLQHKLASLEKAVNKLRVTLDTARDNWNSCS